MFCVCITIGFISVTETLNMVSLYYSPCCVCARAPSLSNIHINMDNDDGMKKLEHVAETQAVNNTKRVDYSVGGGCQTTRGQLAAR